MSVAADAKNIRLLSGEGVPCWKTVGYRRPTVPRKISWVDVSPSSASPAKTMIWSRISGPTKIAAAKDDLLTPSTQIVSQELLQELNECLIAVDDPTERRRPPKVVNRSQDCWGNLALEKQDEGGQDILYRIVVSLEDQRLLDVLQPVLQYLAREYARVVEEVEKTNSSSNSAYAMSAERVGHSEIKAFLLDSQRTELQLPGLCRASRHTVHQLLNGIDVTHETTNRRRNDTGTLIIRKKNT
eukprot:TRINITY_DN11496_c0_g1_i3.p1 TRINITY_DN11496_c0_g1~~TRINITY_DN11496_c0_g1_i3.p1  ORF type:complete len:262 (-),score=35.39 TRINITY_DN11496_c0_g1_i3:496-1221(-)